MSEWMRFGSDCISMQIPIQLTIYSLKEWSSIETVMNVWLISFQSKHHKLEKVWRYFIIFLTQAHE